LTSHGATPLPSRGFAHQRPSCLALPAAQRARQDTWARTLRSPRETLHGPPPPPRLLAKAPRVAGGLLSRRRPRKHRGLATTPRQTTRRTEVADKTHLRMAARGGATQAMRCARATPRYPASCAPLRWPRQRDEALQPRRAVVNLRGRAGPCVRTPRRLRNYRCRGRTHVIMRPSLQSALMLRQGVS
jgi:hypothetical protein